MNEENLIPFNKMTKEQHRELSRKGGKARAEQMARRKTLKEELLLLLELNDHQNKISLAMIEKATKGDTKAFEVIRDTIGEKEPERIVNENSDVDKLIKSIDSIKNGNN